MLIIYILLLILIVLLAGIVAQCMTADIKTFLGSGSRKSKHGYYPYSFVPEKVKHDSTNVVAIGSSSVDPFKLVSSPHLRVFKFSGSTAKGVSRVGHENNKKVLNIVRQYHPQCGIFCFGEVDLNFSYYYRACKEGSAPDPDVFIDEIVSAYVAFIASLDIANKIIVCPYYSPVSDTDMAKHFEKYKQPVCDEVISVFTREKRTALVDKFYAALVKYSAGSDIKIININPDISHDGMPDEKFKDINPLNTHLVWEPLIWIYIEKLQLCGIDRKYLIDTDKSLSKYMNIKTRYMSK